MNISKISQAFSKGNTIFAYILSTVNLWKKAAASAHNPFWGTTDLGYNRRSRMHPCTIIIRVARREALLSALFDFCEPKKYAGDRMFKEFREFIARGNVVDLAVGVIIGAAFG